MAEEEIGEERIKGLTGNRIEDHPSLVNLLWEKRHRPDSFALIWKALTIDAFITLKLTGRAVMNVSAGPFYGVAHDLLNERFDEEMLEEIGIDPAILPPMAREIVGR